MNKLRMGMPSLIELNSFEDTIDLCRELELDFVELNMNLPSNFIENLPSDKLLKTKEKHQISYTMHMPDDMDMGVFFQSVRDGYVKLALDTVSWAREAGVELLNFHIIEGAKMTLPQKKIFIYDQYSDIFVRNFVDSFNAVCKSAIKNKIGINIENSGNFNRLFAQDALNQVLAIEGTGITWDIGHDSANNYIDHDYLMKMSKHITHMHFHDTRGQKDHLVPFDGELDLVNRIDFAVKRNLTVLIEVKTIAALKESVYILRQRNLIPD
ncbi:MAG: sugar phosphate isomerase/epimerase [Eubacteriales bacterium]|nr:sugar phosphate isomerase/epimerase [Eubacteriales bacterium]